MGSSNEGSDNGRRDGALTKEQVRQLLQRSAGLCEFENCAKPLFYDLVSGEICNDGQYAHIIPSSASGPRGGGNESVEYVASVDNRMHLCQTHHRLVDDHPDKYPADCLREMKSAMRSVCLRFEVCLSELRLRPLFLRQRLRIAMRPLFRWER